MARLSRLFACIAWLNIVSTPVQAGMFAGPFRPTSQHPFVIMSAGYATHYRSEFGLGLANMEPGQSGAMMTFAYALRLKIASLDPERVGLGFDFGGVGIMNIYFGAAAYKDESYHAHVCAGIIGNICLRLGGNHDGFKPGIAAELIL